MAILQGQGWAESSRQHVLLVGSLLQLLDDANELAQSSVHYSKFYNSAVSNSVLPYLQTEYVKWIKAKQSGLQQIPPLSLCQLPFLIDPECKKAILQVR